MEDEYKDFCAALGAHIRFLRRQRGWSLRHMVVAHGYHDSQWRKYESGGGLTIPSLLRVASIFGLSIAGLLDGLGEFPRKRLECVDTSPPARKVVEKAAAKRAARKAGLTVRTRARPSSAK